MATCFANRRLNPTTALPLIYEVAPAAGMTTAPIGIVQSIQGEGDTAAAKAL